MKSTFSRPWPTCFFSSSYDKTRSLTNCLKYREGIPLKTVFIHIKLGAYHEQIIPFFLPHEVKKYLFCCIIAANLFYFMTFFIFSITFLILRSFYLIPSLFLSFEIILSIRIRCEVRGRMNDETILHSLRPHFPVGRLVSAKNAVSEFPQYRFWNHFKK